MTQPEVIQVVAEHAPEYLDVISERFSRWPNLMQSFPLCNRLRSRAEMFHNMDCHDAADLCRKAADTIQDHARLA